MSKISAQVWYGATVALIIIGVSLTPIRIISLITCIGLWALYWPFQKVRSSSFVWRLAMAFVLTTCLQQLIGFVFWLARVPFTVTAVVAVELITLALILIRLRAARTPITLFCKEDIAALLISAVSMFGLLFGGLHGGPLLQQLLRQSTTGYDSVQHISLTMSLYENKGYEYGDFNKLKDKIVYNNLSSYPQGWSLSSSIWWHSVSNDLNIQTSPAKVLLLFFAMSVFWFGLMVYLFCRLVLRLTEVMRGSASGLVELVGGLMFTALAEVTVLIGVPANGFVSFYPAIVFPVALTFLIIDLLVEKRRPGVFLLGGLMLAGGVAFSWLLASPAVYAMVLIALVAYFNGSIVTAIKWIIGQPFLLAAGVVILAMASGQGFVQLLYGVKGLVNYPGTAGVLYTVLLFTLLVICLIWGAISKNVPLKAVFTSMVSGIFIISGAVYVYQLVTVGQANYFSTKITFVAFTLILAFSAAVIIANIGTYVAKPNGKFVSILFMVGLVIFIPVASGTDLSDSAQNGIGPISYIQGKRFLSEYSASQIGGLINNHQVNTANLVVFKHLNYNEDIITTHFIQMLSHTAIKQCNQYVLDDLIGTWSINTNLIKSCANDKNFYVITDSTHYALLKHNFASTPNVQIILSN